MRDDAHAAELRDAVPELRVGTPVNGCTWCVMYICERDRLGSIDRSIHPPDRMDRRAHAREEAEVLGHVELAADELHDGGGEGGLHAAEGDADGRVHLVDCAMCVCGFVGSGVWVWVCGCGGVKPVCVCLLYEAGRVQRHIDHPQPITDYKLTELDVSLEVAEEGGVLKGVRVAVHHHQGRHRRLVVPRVEEGLVQHVQVRVLAEEDGLVWFCLVGSVCAFGV